MQGQVSTLSLQKIFHPSGKNLSKGGAEVMVISVLRENVALWYFAKGRFCVRTFFLPLASFLSEIYNEVIEKIGTSVGGIGGGSG